MTQQTPEPVVIRLYVDTGFSGASYEETFTVERDEWDGMLPEDRRNYLDDAARTLMENHIEWGWQIDDEGDRASADDADLGDVASGRVPLPPTGGASR